MYRRTSSVEPHFWISSFDSSMYTLESYRHSSRLNWNYDVSPDDSYTRAYGVFPRELNVDFDLWSFSDRQEPTRPYRAGIYRARRRGKKIDSLTLRLIVRYGFDVFERAQKDKRVLTSARSATLSSAEGRVGFTIGNHPNHGVQRRRRVWVHLHGA
jgi:hypothetical protein